MKRGGKWVGNGWIRSGKGIEITKRGEKRSRRGKIRGGYGVGEGWSTSVIY